jgi:hypothetical protein
MADLVITYLNFSYVFEPDSSINGHNYEVHYWIEFPRDTSI